jgi:hypothetical protein
LFFIAATAAEGGRILDGKLLTFNQADLYLAIRSTSLVGVGLICGSTMTCSGTIIDA